MKTLLRIVALLPSLAAAAVVESDICVYGGTSGGVAAAVQAARMGKSVVIAEPGRHLGGMTSGGLSAVDIGDPRSVGGIAREYFTKLAATVGVTLAWDKAFKGDGGGGPATGGAYAIEPHKAEQVFADMAKEAGVKVHFQARPLPRGGREGRSAGLGGRLVEEPGQKQATRHEPRRAGRGDISQGTQVTTTERQP